MRDLTIINEANKILISLQKLQARCSKLINKATERQCLPPHIRDVIDTLDDLASFDLEDVIVAAYDYES